MQIYNMGMGHLHKVNIFLHINTDHLQSVKYRQSLTEDVQPGLKDAPAPLKWKKIGPAQVLTDKITFKRRSYLQIIVTMTEPIQSGKLLLEFNRGKYKVAQVEAVFPVGVSSKLWV